MAIKKYLVGTAGQDCMEQTHVHEVQGLTDISENHQHRFAGVTGEMIEIKPGVHVHEFRTMTDYYEDHYHKITIRTGPNVAVSGDEHVHYVQGDTTLNDNHKHSFEVSTFQAPNPERT